MESFKTSRDQINNWIALRKMELNDFDGDFEINGNEVVFDSIDRLTDFSHKVKVPLSVLLRDFEKSDLESGVKICRKNQGYRRIALREGTKYYTYQHLAVSDEEPNLMALHCTVHNTDTEKFVLNGGHASKEFIYILNGTIRMHWEYHDQVHQEDLKEGDSVYIRPGISHSFVAVNNEAELLAVNY